MVPMLMMTSLFSQLLHLTIIVIGNGRQALFAGRQYGKKVDWTLIWLTVVKEKTVSPPLRTKGMTAVIAPGHNQRRDLSATIDHSDIRGFDRMTCLHRGAVSL